ncbi:taste receptor type 2 member 43-like [Lithobates pipiens]
MANSTEEDNYESILGENLFLPSLLVILVLAGLAVQLFIVAVNVTDWRKGNSMTGADKIITSIGISRICFHTIQLLEIFLVFFFKELIYYSTENYLYNTISFLEQFSVFSNILLSILLSIFFYIKISTSHNVFFLSLKAIMSRRVTYLIIACVTLSLGYTIMGAFPVIYYTHLTQNNISDIDYGHIKPSYTVSMNMLPLIVFFITSSFLIILLCLHTSRMNNCGNVDIYHRTIIFTALSFLVCSFLLTVDLLQVYWLLLEKLDLFDLYFINNIFPALHSILLIYVATKLRNQFFRIVHFAAHCLFIRKAPGPHTREPVEVTRL